MPIDPLASMHSAMTRKKWRDEMPDNRQSLSQVLSAYTRDAAYVEFAEDKKGRIVEGMLGDLVIFDGDLERTDPDAIETVHPAVTIAGGRVTYEA